MRRWGIAVTTLYSIVLTVLLLPVAAWPPEGTLSLNELLDWYGHSFNWIWLATLVGGQAMLLFLSVDTSWRIRRSRQHIGLTAALAGFLIGVLAFSAAMALALAIKSPLFHDSSIATLFATTAGLRVGWGTLFYLYARGTPDPAVILTSWLLRGSVLELLIAIPAHIVVRQRGECTTPALTGYGIVTGLAIMLLSFGPGVLALYKKRLDAYPKIRENTSQTNYESRIGR